MLLITVREPGREAVCHHFDLEAVTAGRSEACDIVLADPQVSRRHLEIRRDGTGWILRDEGSVNGTALNGIPVRGPEPLSSGDQIFAGGTTLVFVLRLPDAAREDSGQPTERAGEEAAPIGGEPVVVGRSRAIRDVLAAVDRVAPSTVTVLVTGRNGAGKELVARLIHHRSPRREGPFVVVNCPALPGSLVESELFGVEKGVATGVEERRGRFEMAAGGTLLLDEIGDLAPEAQAKILRAIEEKTVERLGGRETIPIDVRIVACTNHDLDADMEKGLFRRDLYHRLNTVTISLPRLSDRLEDVPLLVEHFLQTGEGPALPISQGSLDLLGRYHYPGNVRELRRIVERARLFARGPVIQPEDLPPEVLEGGAGNSKGAGAEEAAAHLRRRIVDEGASFWEVVHRPFLQRQLSPETVRLLVERAYEEAGGSYKGITRLFRIEDRYKKFVNFLQYHDLRVRR